VSGSIDAPEIVRAMFDRIAPRYDLMNRLMTGWQDERWRRAAAEVALQGGATRVLDAATGTGALAQVLLAGGAEEVVALDASSEMLIGAASRLAGCDAIHLLHGDVMQLPFNDGAFDACTIGFGLRNLPDYQLGIDELARVLAPGGRLIVLELSPLPESWFGRLFELFFGRGVPIVGGVVTGDRGAYRYLPESVRNFPDAATLAGMMHNAGLANIRWRYFGAGSVALHVGDKPEGADG
jgi:demethylmenaquinone methyltransferase / 2-methoxy-6-polyprenyl-1,4-benzoquinol methylase